VPKVVFDEELASAVVKPYRSVSFAAILVDHVITTDWLVIEVFCTDEITGAGLEFCNVVKLNVPFVEQFP
jgi:hypothetical protein